MLLRMLLGRIMKLIMAYSMIIEYAVPSLAVNYPCKKYQIIYESVHSY